LWKRHADDVGGQQVARELNALIRQAERLGERVRERRLADAGHILDEQVPARQQARQTQPQLMFFAEDDPVELRDRGADQLDGIRLRNQSWNG
jgi:hypothetical protein